MSEMSRREALEVMNILRFGTFEEVINTREIVNEALDMAIEALNEQRPHGEWAKEYLQIDEHHFRSYAKCKVCGCSFKPYSFAVKEFDFCPKCGSDNRKEEGEAE